MSEDRAALLQSLIDEQQDLINRTRASQAHFERWRERDFDDDQDRGHDSLLEDIRVLEADLPPGTVNGARVFALAAWRRTRRATQPASNHQILSTEADHYPEEDSPAFVFREEVPFIPFVGRYADQAFDGPRPTPSALISQLLLNATTLCPATAASGDDECSICLESLFENERGTRTKSGVRNSKPPRRIVTLPCFHRFHPRCIGGWLQRSVNCPLCNLDVMQAMASNQQ